MTLNIVFVVVGLSTLGLATGLPNYQSVFCGIMIGLNCLVIGHRLGVK